VKTWTPGTRLDRSNQRLPRLQLRGQYHQARASIKRQPSIPFIRKPGSDIIPAQLRRGEQAGHGFFGAR
jgi:hypothetical protein